MTVYVWRGIGPNGRETSGVRDADNVKVLRALLKKEKGITQEEDEEWEAELVSAVLEALSKEVQSEEVGVYCFSLSALLNEVLRGEYCVSVHRLVAALAFLLRLSPSYEGQLAPLLEVLQSRETLEGKLQKGVCGENGVQKPEVRKLIQEVAAKLCPAT